MKHKEITHRTVEKIIFYISLIFFALFGAFCYVSGMPIYVSATMLCIPVVMAIFTFILPAGNLQAYAAMVCMETAATVYIAANNNLFDMFGVFLVIICLTALYRQIGVIVCETAYVTLLCIADYFMYPENFFDDFFGVISNSVVFYVGCAAIIMMIVWFRSAMKIMELRTKDLSDLYKLVEKQKIEAEAGTKEKTDFLANMSHEMRTPMIAVIGMSELLLRNSLTPLEEEYVNTIKNSANNLLNLVNDILDFSKIEANMMNLVEEPYNIENLIAEISNIINVRIGEKDIAFVAEIDANIPSALIGDASRIRQILINLLNNAVKFTDSGMIKIRISYCVDKSGKFWLKAEISDTGIGIAKEDQARLFAEFSQVDTDRNRKIEGTGLGLVISKRLANKMNGDITIESEYGKGSKFTVVIEQRVSDSTELAFVPDPDGYVAYIYEPNDYYRENIRNLMSQLGIAVITVSEIALWDYCSADRFGAILFFDYTAGITNVNSFALKVKRMRLVTLIDRNTFVDAGIKDNILMMHKPILTGQLAALIRGENIDTFLSEKKLENNLFVPEAKIMVVDDNYINLKVAEGLLNIYKPQLRLVSSGREAYDILRSDTSYDMIFMDHMMPEWDGIETVQKIRAMKGEYYQKVPIVALSANVSQNSRELFLSNGMDDFVEKPISTAALSNVIKKFIVKEKQLSEYSEKVDPMMIRNRPRDEYISAAAEDGGGEILIPNIDTSGGIFNMGGSIEAYNNILNVVLNDGRKKIVYLEKYVVDNNIKAYNIETHALKSVAASIGANSLSQLAARHEAASGKGDMQFVRENYRKLINEYTALLRNIEEYLTVNNLLSIRADDVMEDANAQSISGQKKHNAVVEIIRLIDRFDSDRAIEKLHELLKYHLESNDRSAVKKAINQLDDYMFDEAIKTLSSL